MTAKFFLVQQVALTAWTSSQKPTSCFVIQYDTYCNQYRTNITFAALFRISNSFANTHRHTSANLQQAAQHAKCFQPCSYFYVSFPLVGSCFTTCQIAGEARNLPTELQMKEK